MTVKR